MGFFDDLVVPAPEPEPEVPRTRELAPLGRSTAGARPPVDHYLPGVVTEAREVGASEHTRVMFTGWSVWPRQAVLHLRLFRRRYRTDEGGGRRWRDRSGGLRVGLVLADGRRVTTLDGEPWPRPPGSGKRVTLRSPGVSGGGFHHTTDLYLSALPPEGGLEMVVEWPDQQVPETRTTLDAAAVRAAATRAVEIWPDLRWAEPEVRPQEPLPAPKPTGRTAPWRVVGTVRPEPPSELTVEVSGVQAGAGPAFAEVRAVRNRRAVPPDPHRYDPRPDWKGVGDWTDLRLVRARLAGGADPDEGAGTFEGTPLHRAAEQGSAEVVRELAARAREVDRPDRDGRTPLWHAVCRGRTEAAAALLAAGADAWTPLVAGYSPGALALRTASAPVFAGLPGAVPPTEEDRRRQEEADRLIAVFDDLDTEGVGVAFAGGVDEVEAVRRLGGDPAACPVLDLDREPGPHGTGPAGFDPDDFEESGHWVGVTGVPGGVVVLQPMGHLPGEPEVLEPLSRGTTAYAVYFNPKGGTFGAMARNGRMDHREEIGLDADEDSPEGHWLFRFWQQGEGAPFHKGSLAYACWTAGVRLTDAAPVAGPPRRWVRLGGR